MAVMAVGVSACGGDEKAATAKDEVASTPKVAFTSPGVGESVGSKFTAKVEIAGFQIDAKDVGKKAVDGRGHLHFSLDGGKYDSAKFSGANGKLAEQLGTDGKYSPSHRRSPTKGSPRASTSSSRPRQQRPLGQRSDGQGQLYRRKRRSGEELRSGEKVAFEDVQTTSDGFTADVGLSDVELGIERVPNGAFVIGPGRAVR